MRLLFVEAILHMEPDETSDVGGNEKRGEEIWESLSYLGSVAFSMWDMNSQEDQHTWAVQWMKRIPEMVQDTQSWIGMGHLIDYNQTSLISSVGFRAAVTMPVFDNQGEWVRNNCLLGGCLAFIS